MKPSERIKELESFLHSSEPRSNAILKYLDEEWEKKEQLKQDCLCYLKSKVEPYVKIICTVHGEVK